MGIVSLFDEILILLSFQLSGRVTYNGHGMDEFVPQRTSAYTSQYDLHAGEMTVRETLDFSARCQGAGGLSGLFHSHEVLLNFAHLKDF